MIQLSATALVRERTKPTTHNDLKPTTKREIYTGNSPEPGDSLGNLLTQKVSVTLPVMLPVTLSETLAVSLPKPQDGQITRWYALELLLELLLCLLLWRSYKVKR